MDAVCKFHASLHVTDLPRSVAFYRALLGIAPAKQRRDYAKFELEIPPLVLSLIPGRPTPGGPLNHLGLRLPGSAALLEMQMRLATAGIATTREEGVECCHSTQTKFWAADPDQTLWEVYVLHEDDEEDHDLPARANPPVPTVAAQPVRLIWQHQLPNPFPGRIPHDDNSLHEVVLEGTANLSPGAASLNAACVEAYRVLRPGGEVRLHGLAGDRPLLNTPALPGPASAVQHVPLETEPMRALVAAGFAQVRFEKLSPKPYFVVDCAQMREFLLTGRKPGHRPKTTRHQAIYLGPPPLVVDDYGHRFARGERVQLNIHDWQLLKESVVKDQFLFLAPDADGGTCCGGTHDLDHHPDAE